MSHCEVRVFRYRLLELLPGIVSPELIG